MNKVLILISISIIAVNAWGQSTKDTIIEDHKLTNIPVISLSDSDLQNDAQSQDISGLLQSSSDVFVSVAGYTFGQA
ncbi:MAG TPA: hypothetical protein PLK75_09785, partial [Bacteroidales bacterium]|nr:hypothetical protein [Bacteroidales bacterium]